MSDSNTVQREDVLLSMQRALWEMVTPDLRGVAVSWGPSTIAARFLYDLADPEAVTELVSEVETYVLADFPPSVTTDFATESLRAPQPRELKPGEWWVYLRREE